MADKSRQSANLVSDTSIYVNPTTDNVGIGTTNSTSKLTVAGDLIVSGVVTASSFSGNASSATYANNAGISTSIIGGIVSATQINVSGVSTLGVTTTSNLSATQLNISGIATIASNLLVDGNTLYVDATNNRVGILTVSPLQPFQIGAAGTTAFVVTSAGSVGIGTTNPANTLTVVGTTDIQGAVETVSVASTFVIGGTKYLLECNAQNGTVFTHSIPSGGNIGIISFRNFPATKNSITTFTIFVTQNSTGTGNTTAVSGIGTNIQLWPTGAISGLTTSARVSSGSTVVLPTTANDIDIVNFAVHYNGAGAATTTNYTVYVSDMSSFRFGTIRP